MILPFDRIQATQWFEDQLRLVKCGKETRAYLTGVLTERVVRLSGFDDSSIVIAYQSAQDIGRFEDFQRLGDWILWCGIVAPRRYENHQDVYENIGRLSYYACHRILRGRWFLYEELADELPRIVRETRSLSNISLTAE